MFLQSPGSEADIGRSSQSHLSELENSEYCVVGSEGSEKN